MTTAIQAQELADTYARIDSPEYEATQRDGMDIVNDERAKQYYAQSPYATIYALNGTFAVLKHTSGAIAYCGRSWDKAVSEQRYQARRFN